MTSNKRAFYENIKNVLYTKLTRGAYKKRVLRTEPSLHESCYDPHFDGLLQATPKCCQFIEKWTK